MLPVTTADAIEALKTVVGPAGIGVTLLGVLSWLNARRSPPAVAAKPATPEGIDMGLRVYADPINAQLVALGTQQVAISGKLCAEIERLTVAVQRGIDEVRELRRALEDKDAAE